MAEMHMAEADLTGGAAPEKAGARFSFAIMGAAALSLAAAGYIVLQPKVAGLPGAVFLAGLALTGLGILLFRALAPRARSARRLSRGHGLALLEGTREALALTGREGELLYANKAYRGRFGAVSPTLALSGGDAAAASAFRLLRTGLEQGRAAAEIAPAGQGALKVAVEQIMERDGGAGLFVWRIGEASSPVLSLLVDDRSRETGAGGATAPARRLLQDGLLRDGFHLENEPSEADRPLPVAARIVDEAPIGIVLLDSEGVIVEANRSFRGMLGRGVPEPPRFIGQRFEALTVEADRADLTSRLAQEGAEGPQAFELRLAAAAGEGPQSEQTAQVYLTRLDGTPDGALTLLYVVDTTEQKNLELQFAQSQKMQAVGQLAGGIAHDFNNTLQAIIGFCELLLTYHPPGDPSFADIDQIRQNATRAAGLVRQLLAFSRQQTLMPKVIWLPDAVAENRMLLKRLLGERVTLEIKHDRDLWQVRVDETQLIQVLMNLAVNARDAMPDGGTLSIRTANVPRAEAAALGHELMRPDDYVLIEVADTGCGIQKELLGKIFEPFFTTKPVGQGTGLGLSTVYGIVKQTNGFIFPESEPGKGTVFRIYLPRHVEQGTAVEEEPALEVRAQDHTGHGTVLLVEDEDAVRSFAARALSTRGYSVLEASGGDIALDLLHAHDGKIDLLISDVIMPGLDGPSLVKAVRAERPDMRIILISGYAEDAFRKELARAGHDLAFLPKPFSLKQLISKVKEVMAA